jgi:hypothetical protein
MNYILICSVFFHSVQKATVSSNYADFYSRTQLNDSSANLLYFFWTHFFYLPLFFFILLHLIHVFIHSVPKTSIVYAACIAILPTYYSLNNYHSLNTAGAVLCNTSTFNLLLSNPTNKYHPLLFYMASLLTILLFSKTPQTYFTFSGHIFSTYHYFFLFFYTSYMYLYTPYQKQV